MNHQKSEALFAKACRYIPGGVNSPVRAFANVKEILLRHSIPERGCKR